MQAVEDLSGQCHNKLTSVYLMWPLWKLIKEYSMQDKHHKLLCNGKGT